MANIGDIFLTLIADDKRFQAQVVGAGDRAGQSMGQRIGGGLEKAFVVGGAVAGALAIPALQMGDAYKEAADSIRVGTGLIGEDLASVEESFKRVAGRVPEDIRTVAQVTADLQTRTGLMGEALETLTQSVLDYSRITGTDAVQNTAELTRVFGDWGIATEDQIPAMDALLRAQQATGVGAAQLQQQIVKYGAPMRQLGFSFEETAALLGKFEKEGVNTELVMGSMRIALGKMAKAGEEPVETLQRMQEEIRNTGDAGEANALAIELFGARAGPDMAAAIREGRFDIGELMDTLENGTDTVAGLADETKTAGDRLKGFFNSVTTAVGPFTEGLAGISQVVGPLIYSLPLLGAGLGKMIPGLTEGAAKLVPALAGAVGAAGTAVGTIFTAAASLVIAAWPLILAGLIVAAIAVLIFNEDIRNAVFDFVGGILGWIGDALGAVAGLIGDIFGAAFGWVSDNVITPFLGFLASAADVIGGIFAAIGDAIAATVGFITGVIETLIDVISTVFGWIGGAGTALWDTYWGVISFVVETYIGIITGIIETVIDVVSAVAGWIGGVGRALFDGAFGAIKAVVETYVGWIGGIIGGIVDVVAGVASAIGGFFDFVTGGTERAKRQINEASVAASSAAWEQQRRQQTPGFQTGAWEIPRDTLAFLHAGEMVVPAGPAEDLRSGAWPDGKGGGGDTINVYLQDRMETRTPRDIADGIGIARRQLGTA